MADQGVEVDEHADADEEIGDEEGVADELDVAHQRRRGRNETVEHDAHEERTENAFHADELHQTGAEKDENQHEDILHNALIVATEEPASEPREGVDDEQTEENHFDHQPNPGPARDVFFEHTAHHCQHEQRQRVCHNRPADGDVHGGETRETVAEDDGIGNERVGGIHRRHQHCCRHTETQQVTVGEKADEHGDDETK